jgi:membrane protease YdiL (CAAX protease family)
VNELVPYLLRVAPALGLAALLLALVPRKETAARLAIHVLVFILVRDAMTPAGLWRLASAPVFWLRFTHSLPALWGLTVSTVGLVAGIAWLERPLMRSVVLWEAGRIRAVLCGLACALLIAAPVIVLGRGTPVALRGGAVAGPELATVLVFTLVGNSYEELLFRGFLQGELTARVGAGRAALLSGLGFALGHAFLATTVTDVGPSILAFTAYEGLICAELRRRFGLVPPVIAHGGGIFLIGSGLL